MLLTVEPDGPVPIYQQVRDRIVEAIASGEQPAGSALPSTRQLATDLGVTALNVQADDGDELAGALARPST
jgi:DNA-binding transcriptional regulator YhcF (GntR family)